jgi:hypothetical protein
MRTHALQVRQNALAFLNFIRSPAARPTFERQHVMVLGPGGKSS